MVLDRWGILQRFPSKAGSFEYYNAGPITVKGDDVFNIYSKSGFNERIAKANSNNQKQMAITQIMQDQNDWKNVEVTCEISLTNPKSLNDQIVIFARSGNHTDKRWCPGSAYRFDFGYDGKVRWSKEQWHSSYTFKSWKDAFSTNIKDKTVRIKAILYNVIINAQIFVKAEFWIDEQSNGTWVKCHEDMDAGGWGNDGALCGGDKDQIILWGGPIVGIHVQSGTIIIKWLSCREIVINPNGDNDPGSGGGPPTGGGGGGDTGTGGTGTPPGPPPPVPVPVPQTPNVNVSAQCVYSIDAQTGFPEAPPPAGYVMRTSRQRYNVASYFTSHCSSV
jgi:hypothetical protein